jgi:hypothetical protein
MPQLSKFINASLADPGHFSPELLIELADAKFGKKQDFRAANRSETDSAGNKIMHATNH